MRVVKIHRTDGGRRRYPVLFCAGPFAVHRSWSRAPWCLSFTVTHAPSGLACFKASHLAPAKRVARALSGLPICCRRASAGDDDEVEAEDEDADEDADVTEPAPKARKGGKRSS